MIELSGRIGAQPSQRQAKDWVKVLASYREPSNRRSTYELAITAIPFVVLWGVALYAMSISYWLALGGSLLIAPFLLRLFAIQHDCGHGSFFSNRTVSDWVGRCIGVLTLTPYDVWRRAHSIHHSSAGNLNRRGMGDILTLTVEEFSDLTPFGRLKYRLYRHPVTMFGFGPGYLFLLENRLPLGLMNGARYWVSSMGTNIAILLAVALIWYLGGAMPLLLIFLPSTLIAATAGVWLFYVQHQFEHTQWESEENWQLHESALHGSSHYVLPSVLQWISANIGIHHVHHLYSRIPFYRLPEVLQDHAELAQSNRMTIGQSLSTVKLKLWDTDSKRLVSFSEARALHG
ncbi:fatty acid desaturase [Aliiruegeria sabulilitoris]|uniref:fatty acid desaturase n=1 Tax=Aliiruegeria sabulilitoris TaxID=1510458 RepID=UPI00083505EE|nr:fatty acid desaturase [Aliiruegeria sabulilitoris]NDR57791.1 fatty acid desaturase [Pseudoruegeria sp. M32A2M]